MRMLHVILEAIQILVSFSTIPKRASIRLVGIQCLAPFRRWAMTMQSVVFKAVGILVGFVAIFHQTAIWLLNQFYSKISLHDALRSAKDYSPS